MKRFLSLFSLFNFFILILNVILVYGENFDSINIECKAVTNKKTLLFFKSPVDTGFLNGECKKEFIILTIKKKKNIKLSIKTKILSLIDTKISKNTSIFYFKLTDKTKRIRKSYFLFNKAIYIVELVNGEKENFTNSTSTFLLSSSTLSEILNISEHYNLSEIKKLIFNIPSYITQKFNRELVNTNKEIEKTKNDIGLKLIGDYAHNSSLGIPEFDEGPYKWRARAGVEWKFLDEGFLKRIFQKKALKLEKEVLSKKKFSYLMKESLDFRRNYIIYLFANEKIKNLELRKLLVSHLLEERKKSFLKGESLKKELIKLQEEMERINNLLSLYKNYKNTFLASFYENYPKEIIKVSKLGVFDIKLDEVIISLSSPKYIDEFIKLKKKESFLKNNFFSNINLKGWVYYYHYDRITRYNNFFQTGVRISIPFPFSINKKSEFQKAQVEKEISSFFKKLHSSIAEAQNSYAELKYKIDDYIKYKYKFLREKENFLNTYSLYLMGKKKKSELFPILKRILEIKYELLHIKERIFIKLAEVLKNINEAPEKFLYPVNKEASFKTKKAVYLWSEGFFKYKNSFILAFLHSRNISKVFLSHKVFSNNEKTKEFIELLKIYGIKPAILVSNNYLIFKNRRKKLGEIVALGEKYRINEIHLDVEFYLLKEYHKNKEEYEKLYLEMVEHLSESGRKKGIKITLSIPLKFNLKFIKKLIPHVYEIYYMVYGENLDKNHLNELLKEYGCEKTCVSLRVKDYRDEFKLEEKVEKLKEKGFLKFSFHDFTDLTTIGVNNEN